VEEAAAADDSLEGVFPQRVKPCPYALRLNTAQRSENQIRSVRNGGAKDPPFPICDEKSKLTRKWFVRGGWEAVNSPAVIAALAEFQPEGFLIIEVNSDGT
jgi:hypothetical protein